MSDLMDELEKEMSLLNKEMEEIERDTRKMVDILVKKHQVLLEYEEKAPNPIDQFKINTMRSDIFCQILIFQFKAELEEDIAKIVSRLDNLETKLQELGSGKKQ